MKRTFRPTNYGKCKFPRLNSAPCQKEDFNRMKVCVRVRPFSNIELQNSAKSIIDVIDQNMLVFDPFVYEQADDKYSYHGRIYKKIGKRANKNLQFIFDRVFNQSESNLTVYNETTKNLVSSLLAGFNCSIFAYGSTGSGKTHTMLGSLNDPGVIFFTTMDLYKNLEKEADRNLELSISYFEIYNEIIYDLLDPVSGHPLSLLDDGNKGMTVKNLSQHQPRNAEHLLEMLEKGNKNRKQHPTDANSESSRSHAIFQINLQRKDFSNQQEMSIKVSKMSLIDLAGSERASVAYKTYRNQCLAREGGNINKSLLSLGNCINALANNKKNSYIPYRSSKLTLILRDSLGGNCQTLMIATISPSAHQYEEIHNTLIYAERAKGVQLNVKKNNISISVQPRDYKHMFDMMAQEKNKLLGKIELLEQENRNLKTKQTSVPDDPIITSHDALAKLHSVKNVLDELFKRRMNLRTKYLDCHHNLKLLDLRLMFRKFDNERLKLLEQTNEVSDDKENEKKKSEQNLHSIYSQKLHYSNLQSSLKKEIDENESQIKKLEYDLSCKTNDDIIVKSYFVEKNSLVQANDSKFYDKHSTKMSEEVYLKFEFVQDFSSDMVNFIYKSHQILNGLGLLSFDMSNKFSNIIQKVKGKKNVFWRDDIASPKMNNMQEFVEFFKLPVYMANSLTPIEKRALVDIRDITPLNNNVLITKFSSNTITKMKIEKK